MKVKSEGQTSLPGGTVIDKAPDAYRTISEAAEELDLPQHVLRFWETRFSQVKPLKRGGGRRYYRPEDVELLKGIRHLLYSEGYTIKGVQRILKEQGPKAVQALMHELAPEDEPPAAAPPPPPPPPPPAPRREAPARIEPVLAAPPPAPIAMPPFVAEPLLPPVAAVPPPPVAIPVAPLAPPASLASASTEADLFSAQDIARAMAPPAPTPSASPVAPPVAAPAQPTVSFMRGGLGRASAPAQPSAPEAEPVPAAGVNVRRTIRPILPEEEVAAPPPAEPAPPARPPRAELTEAGRRALQSALFELSECRRVIERLNATMARGR